MRFSILTPTLDRPEFLARAVASVDAQTWAEWEHIVVDVGETPIAVAPDRRRKLFRKAAEGPALDFQYALDQATGDIIHPLADDDELVPEALAAVAKAIGEAEWLVARTELRNEDGGTIGYRGGTSADLAETLAGQYMLGGAVYWRRSLTERLGGFDHDYDGAADFDLYVRFAKDSIPALLGDVLYLYTDHPGTDSNVRQQNQAAQSERIRLGLRR